MFIKKEKIEQIEQLLENLNGRIKNQNQDIAKLQDGIQEAADKLSEFDRTAQESTEKVQNNLRAASQLHKELQTEIVDMKVFLSKTKNDLLQEFRSEFSKSVENLSEQMYAELAGFKELKKKMEFLNDNIDEISHQSSKFLNIAEGIKDTDFALTKYSQIIKETEKEKSNMRLEIDRLQRIVAKNRRNSNRY